MATQNSTYTSNPVTVSQGGTGDASVTAYAPICGGTTTTGTLQSATTGISNSGYVLTSTGSSSLPTFQAAGGSSGAVVLLKTYTASTSANITFSSTYITGTYSAYLVTFNSIVNDTNSVTFNMDWSTNNGSGYLGSAYRCGLNSNPYNSATLTNANSTSTCTILPANAAANVISSGQIYLFLPASATASYIGQLYDAVSTPIQVSCFGINTGTTTINNIKFSYSSGNILSGTISLYGIAS